MPGQVKETNNGYNIARMNMILHNVYSDRFDIRHGDSLENPQHMNLRFEAVVANPLFNTQWSGNPLLMLDKRFRPWGRIAPKSNADYAIIQHMYITYPKVAQWLWYCPMEHYLELQMKAI